MDDKQWHDERRMGVGASEAAALCGCSPWMTPLGLYLRKTGELIDEPTTRMRFGLYFEMAIKDAYENETGRTLEKPPRILRHADAPWMIASLDFWADDRVVDAKKSSERAAEYYGPSGSSEMPRNYYLQLQQQMAVSGRDLGELAVLIGDDDFRILHCDRNQSVIDHLIEIEREFMDAVERREPPLPDFKHATISDLLAQLEPEVGSIVDLDDDAAKLAIAYDVIGKQIREAEKLRDKVKARLLFAVGDAETAYLPRGLGKITRKIVDECQYAVTRKSYVRMGVSLKHERVSDELSTAAAETIRTIGHEPTNDGHQKYLGVTEDAASLAGGTPETHQT